jgi:alpha-tubulin suppressor-like RCC1 family protein
VVADVSSGRWWNCGIKSDGTLWCWGRNTGTIGDNTTTQRTVPTQEASSSTNWIDVSASHNVNTCGVKSDGTLWCWGFDTNEQLGNGPGTTQQNSPVQEATLSTDWAQVTAGNYWTCAIKTDGTLWCWGSNTDGVTGLGITTGTTDTPAQVTAAGDDWVQVESGRDHSCAVKISGDVYCWGDANWSGALGNGELNQDASVPEKILGSYKYTQVSYRDDQDYQVGRTCAIRDNGKLYCWGYNGDWQGTLASDSKGLWSGFTPYPSLANCDGPFLNAGEIVYNSGSNDMQYCNGVSWVRIGGGQ